MPRPKRSEVPRPFLKWAGGKTQLLGQFEALYPPRAQVKRYLEPFLGSGAVFFHIRRVYKPEEIVLADSNLELVDTYRAIQQNAERVIRLLSKHRKAHSREHYYLIRSQRPSELSPSEKAARTIYLNKTCFNGLYRVNSQGGFNVPMGRYDDPPILDARNLRSVAAALRNVELRGGHFRDTLQYARKGDFIYFDPPYQPLSTTALFTAYTRQSFGSADQEELAETFRLLSERGCRVMLSNSNTPLIRQLYRGFDLRNVDARRSINSKADRRGAITEIVVLNYEPSEPTVREISLERQPGEFRPRRKKKHTGRSTRSRRTDTAAGP